MAASLAFDPNAITFGTPTGRAHDLSDAGTFFEANPAGKADAVILRGCACGMSTMLLTTGAMSPERLAALGRLLRATHPEGGIAAVHR